jgi:hypothetical protein
MSMRPSLPGGEGSHGAEMAQREVELKTRAEAPLPA